MKNDIKIGEWFCAEEGIAIAERIHNFYFEEYDHIPEDKDIGDYKLSMIEYKLFCNYDGKPIRRNRFKTLRNSYCEPLDKKYKKVLEASIKNFPKEYASFVKFLGVQKATNEILMLFYELTEENKLNAVQEIEKIQKALPNKFTFEDVLNTACNHCVIDFKKQLSFSDRLFASKYLRIILGYRYGDFKGKRVLFHSFHYDICE